MNPASSSLLWKSLIAPDCRVSFWDVAGCEPRNGSWFRTKNLQRVSILDELSCRVQRRRRIRSAGVFMWECLQCQSANTNEWKHWPAWQHGAEHLWGLVSVTHSNQFCLVFFWLFWGCQLSPPSPHPKIFSSIMDASQVLSSYHTKLHLHLLHGGAGWPAAGLNECNDQALCGSHSLSAPLKKKKKAPSNRRESDIVPANSLALIRSVLGGWGGLKGFGEKGFMQWCNKWIMGENTGVRKPTDPSWLQI